MRTKSFISFTVTLFVTLLLFALLYVFVVETGSIRPSSINDANSITVFGNSEIAATKQDLVVTNAVITSKMDTSIRYTYTIKNDGAVTIPSLYKVSIRNFYSKKADIVDADNVNAGVCTIDTDRPLAPGETYTGTCYASGTIPKEMKYLVFEVDYDNILDEEVEINNTYSLLLAPDLVFTDAKITSKNGDQINYTYTIKNNGCTTLNDLYYINIQNIYSANTTYNDKGDVPSGGCILGIKRSLAPGESYTGTFYSIIKAPIGMNYMLIKIDGCDIEKESDEKNNTYILPLMPDLEITDIKVISKAQNQVNYEYTIKNNGINTVPSLYNISIQNFYSANDIFYDENDVAAGGGVLAVDRSLAPGESYTGTFAAFGAVPSGMNYVTGMVDWGDNIRETNEDNNKFATKIPYI